MENSTNTTPFKLAVSNVADESSMIKNFVADDAPLTSIVDFKVEDVSTAKSSTDMMPLTILQNWGAIVHSDVSFELYNKLLRIASRPKSWQGENSLPLQKKSLNGFLRFWETVKATALEPELALAPDGSLHAEWYKSDKNRLDARFTDNIVIFGLFASNRILEGADQIPVVASILLAHDAKPLLWRSS